MYILSGNTIIWYNVRQSVTPYNRISAYTISADTIKSFSPSLLVRSGSYPRKIIRKLIANPNQMVLSLDNPPLYVEFALCNIDTCCFQWGIISRAHGTR